MAATSALAVAAKLPWSKIISWGAQIASAAKDIYGKWSSKPKPPAIDPHAEVKTQLAAITKRIENLEATETEQVKVVKEIAEQLQHLSIAVGHLSARCTVLMWATGTAALLSCIAIVLSLR